MHSLLFLIVRKINFEIVLLVNNWFVQASYEYDIFFHWMQKPLNLISLSKAVNISFAILKQFFKLKILNALNNSNNSLLCSMAMSIYIYAFIW